MTSPVLEFEVSDTTLPELPPLPGTAARIYFTRDEMRSYALAAIIAERARAAAPARLPPALDMDMVDRLRRETEAVGGTLTPSAARRFAAELHSELFDQWAAAPAGEAQSDKAFHDQMTWGAEFKRLLDDHWVASNAARARTRAAVIAHVNLLNTGAALGWRVRAALADAAPATQEPKP